jgi:ABC-type transporter Mla subunit MlaD
MTSKRTKNGSGQTNTTTASTPEQSARIKNASRSVTNIVKDAAEILNEEVASGIIAARQMQDRFKKENRIDPKDFQSALEKFNADAHEVLNLLTQQIDELHHKDNVELTRRLMDKTHDVLDLSVGMVNISAKMANELIQKNTRPTEPDRATNGK